MTRTRSSRFIIAVLIAVLLMVPAAVASAQTGPAVPPPIAIKGPRLAPPAIPHSSVLDPYVIYNNLLVPPGLPAQSLEADAADGGRAQEKPGRGIRQTATGIGFGLLLYDTPNVCNNFDPGGDWASLTTNTDIWTDWFGGWAPFAIDNGYYQAKNVTFSRERSVGPGNTYVHAEKNMATAQHSAKIASNRPMRRFGSPIIPVPEGFEGGKALVTVKYLIWDHDTGGGMGDGWDYDWASLGVKPVGQRHGCLRQRLCSRRVGRDDQHHRTWRSRGHHGAVAGPFTWRLQLQHLLRRCADRLHRRPGNGAYLKDCKLAESVK